MTAAGGFSYISGYVNVTVYSPFSISPAARELVESAVEQVGDVAGVIKSQSDFLCFP